jgi:pimeloyl-ACP methyl ester carboxylesterase
MNPDDISWLLPGAICNQMIDLYALNDVLLVSPMSWRATEGWVLPATNHALAFTAGLGRNKGSALRVLEDDMLTFMGINYRSENGIPALSPGSSTNGIAADNNIDWFRILPTPGDPVTIDLTTDQDLTVYLYDTNSTYIGQANRAHAFHLDGTQAGPLLAAIVRSGTNTGPWHLTVHTKAVPFYVQQAPDNWPAEIISRSNLYGDLDFGYVFVHENRSNPSGNLLKIAIARMKSSNPAARPLLFCNGGPDDSGIRCAYQHYLSSFTNSHHVVLIDPRGVGYSQPNLSLWKDESPAEFQYRLSMLQGADLSTIHTLEASHDLEDLASALAIAEADVIAQSYGTLLAQTLMRRNPSWLRAVILDGVAAPSIPGLSQTGLVRNEALQAFFADIASDPHASIWYPNFAQAFDTLASSLQNNPVTIQFSSRSIEMDGLAFLDASLNQMTSTDLGTRERIPSIVWRALQGETAALAELITGFKKDTNLFVNSFHNPVTQILVIKHDFLPYHSTR